MTRTREKDDPEACNPQPPQQQPKEYIITMGRIIKARNMLMVDGYHNADVLDRMVNLLRARPHTSPPAPNNQWTYKNGFDDGFAGAEMKYKEAAKASREQVLDELVGKLIYFFEEEAEGMLRGLPLFSEVDALSPKQVMQWIESLRAQQEEER